MPNRQRRPIDNVAARPVSKFASTLVPKFARKVVGTYPELLAVLIAGTAGLIVPAPFRWLVAHQGINVLLVVLVFSTAVTITVADLRGVTAVRNRLLIALIVGITVLPAMSWGVAHVIGSGPLRHGVLTIGLAPCEIASVATTAMAGGQAASAAVMLIGSTLLSVVCAGPLLALEAGHSSVNATTLIVNLTFVVVVPLVVGIAVGARTSVADNHASRDRANRSPDLRFGTLFSALRRSGGELRSLAHARSGRALTAGNTATCAVAGLVGLIASQVHLSSAYFGVLAAIVVFLAGSALIGWLLARGASADIATSIVLTTSMRDFAIAAGIASAAFGAAAAAPLGLYGIVVLVWGTTVAGALRRRQTNTVQPTPTN